MTERAPAFSLLEVVLAVGLFALGIVGVGALFTPTARSVEARGGAARTAGLAHAIRQELERFRDAMDLPPEASTLDHLAAAIGDDGLRLVADRNSERLQIEDEGGLPLRERYHLILVRCQQGALAHQEGAGFLALTVTVRWPYRLPAGVDDAGWVVGSGGEAMRFAFALRP